MPNSDYFIITMATLEASLKSEWQRKINASPEVKQAKQNLEFHKRKMMQLQEELASAEVWETELKERLKTLEEKVKPALMIFCDQLEKEGAIDNDVIEEIITGNDVAKIFTILKKKLMKVDEMDRSQLVGMMNIVLSVRNCLAEKDSQDGVDMMQEMARNILKQMGRPTINWLDMKEWEVNAMKNLLKEVDGIPGFVGRLVDQLLDMVKNRTTGMASSIQGKIL